MPNPSTRNPRRLAVVPCARCNQYQSRIDGRIWFDCGFHRATYPWNRPRCLAAIVGWSIDWQPSGLRWEYIEDMCSIIWILRDGDGVDVGQLWRPMNHPLWLAFAGDEWIDLTNGSLEYCARALVAKVRDRG